ncbi:MAG: hypothetical protein ACYCVN_12365 [Acidimicrobiales bacterium]
MSSSTILLFVLGLALLGNTIVGGLPDKLIALGNASTSPASSGKQGASSKPGAPPASSSPRTAAQVAALAAAQNTVSQAALQINPAGL